MAEPSSWCPCGAMLPLPDASGLVTCPSCGRVTRSPAAAPAAAPAPSAGSSPDDGAPLLPLGPMPRPASSRGWASRVPVGAAVIAVLVAAVGIVALLRSGGGTSSGPGGGGGEAIRPLSGTGTLLDPGASPSQVVLTAMPEQGPSRQLALVELDDEEARVRWTSDALAPDAYDAVVVPGGDVVVAIVEDDLRVIDAASGEQRWQTTLRDRVPSSCPSCVAVVEGTLLVETLDAYVIGYDLETGEQRWERRLRSPSGGLQVVGDLPLIIDDPEDPSAPTRAELIAPATGRVVASASPTCEPDAGRSWSSELSPGQRVHAVPGSGDAVAVLGSSTPCAVRWDPTDGTVRWARTLDGWSSFQTEASVVGDDHLVLTDGSQTVVAVSLADGAARGLSLPVDTRAVPAAIADGVLVATTETTRGTSRHGLVAWDLASGERLWAVRPAPDAAPAAGTAAWAGDALFDGSPRSVLVVEGERIGLVVFDGTSRSITSSSVGRDDGEVEALGRVEFATDGGIPSMAVEGIGAERLIVTIDSTLHAISLDGPPQLVSLG